MYPINRSEVMISTQLRCILEAKIGGNMHFRNHIFAVALSIVLSLTQGRIAAQAQTVNAKAKTAGQTWIPPRAPDGHPDLQGVWANNNATPLQRPKALEGRASLTDLEVEALKKKAAELYDGSGDTEFGDTVFETVWTALQNGETGPHKKGRNGWMPRRGSTPVPATTAPPGL